MSFVSTADALPTEYFAQPTLEIARDLLGATIVRELAEEERLVARIVETEAYTEDDPACHAWQLLEKSSDGEVLDGKGAELFGSPGTAYIYLCYGVHWLFNVVTEPEGRCGAVLVRAVEPLDGIEIMRQNRSSPRRDVDLTNGPGKLTQALDIDDRFHEQVLSRPDLYLAPGDSPSDAEIIRTPRIGITKATDRRWRFILEDNSYVSSR